MRPGDLLEETRGHPVQCSSQSRPPGALDWCAGGTGAVGTARNTRHHSWSSILDVRTGKGYTRLLTYCVVCKVPLA